MRTAITGGAAVGKSTALEVVRELGYRCISADEVAAEVLERTEVQSAISEALRLPRPVDRSALRAAILANPSARRALNAIMHPRIVERLASGDEDFFEIPLLIESCLYGRFDEVWLLDCGRDLQLQRLRERGLEDEEARRLIDSQLPSEAKFPFADVVIRTNREPAAVRDDISDRILARRAR